MKKGFCVLILLLISLALTSCSLLPEEEVRRVSPITPQTEAQEFTYAYCTRGDLELTKKFTATYVPIRKVNLYFGVSGEYIDEVNVQPGDSVKEGDLLASLKMEGVEEEIASCRRELESLELQLRQLEENRALALERTRVLYAEDAEALSDALEQTNASYDQRASSLNDTVAVRTLKLDTLLENREKRRVYAPIDGTVTYVRKFTESSLSADTEKVITVADSTMSLFTLTTDRWDCLPEGMPITVTVKKIDYEAVVTSPEALGLPPVERVPGEKSTVYLTLVTPAPDLEDNDKGSFTLLLDSRRDALRISEKALSRAGEDYIVYYRTDEGVRSYKKVVLGLRAGGLAEVLEGLTEGEAVILS